ncbi:MAG: hypothetical protein OXC10_03225 [Rhodospirillaceae bacterium]|nr:hypothetical protein [Rhodospirillaceae bacterium]
MKKVSRGTIRRQQVALIALAGAIVFFIYDLVVDVLLEGEFGTAHFFIELVVFAGVSTALVFGARDLRRVRRRLEAEKKITKFFSQQLAESIEEQMDEWEMTRSEKDVAWLIIKGYRFLEIAEIRNVKESTARLQATSLYAKAAVSGRAEFVAEMLLPLLLSATESSENNGEETQDG